MRWLKPSIRQSIYGLLGHSTEPSASTLENGTEDIREAMLVLLGDVGPKRFPHVTRRVRYANDIQALWYLRGDLMAALAAMHGESKARQKIRERRLFRRRRSPSQNACGGQRCRSST